VATEKTMWPKATHFAFVQDLIAKLPVSLEGAVILLRTITLARVR
jgi:hypothetical protein